MGIHRKRGQDIVTGQVVMTAAGGYVMTNEAVLVVKKTSGAATAVTLPKTPAAGQRVTVKDGKGDAGTNAITISPAAGTIDGASTFVISSNYGSVILQYNGTEWGAVISGSLSPTGTITFQAMPRIPVTTVVATGAAQGNANALSEGMNLVTGADGTKGVILPSAVIGAQVLIKNTAGSTLKVWPAVAQSINALSANSNFGVATVTSVTLVAVSATLWEAFPTVPS